MNIRATTNCPENYMLLTSGTPDSGAVGGCIGSREWHRDRWRRVIPHHSKSAYRVIPALNWGSEPQNSKWSTEVRLGPHFRSSTFRRDGERFTSHADELDSLAGVEVSPDRGPRELGLRVHEARRRISELSRHTHDLSCIVAGAILRIANKDQSHQHQPDLVYRAEKPAVVSFAERACSAILGRGVKTAT